MLGEITQEPVAEESYTFSPNKENVLNVVEAIDNLLTEKFGDVQALDILVAVEGYAASMKEALGVGGLTAVEEAHEV